MKPSVQTILDALTLEEKLRLVRGNGLWKTAGLPAHGIAPRVMTDGTYGVRYNLEQIESDSSWDFEDFLSVVRGEGGGTAKGGNEVLMGKSQPATCFPNGSSLACSWDVALLEKVGSALANECLHYGVDILLGPGINIRRTPLAGRGYEYYSEDPVVTGDLAAGLIRGLQGKGVGAVLKHFACNNSEYKRTQMNSVLDERTLREIYLSGFERAIRKSDPWAVMTSYNNLNGSATSSNPWLVNHVLREEWGYQGLVMTDWYGNKDCVATLKAGTDLAMPEVSKHAHQLRAAFDRGEFTEQVLDQACLRVLTLLEKLPPRSRQNADFNAHHELAQQVARESIVLLKNESETLPILPGKVRTLGVIGKPATIPVIQGSGCATTAAYRIDIPLDEIVDVAGTRIKVDYAIGASDDLKLDERELREALELAARSDVVVVFASTAIGVDGENGDRADLSMIASHEALIQALCKVHKKLVVVLCNGESVTMPWLDGAQAVVETFFSGQGMGRAVADILFGHCNPSGKLTVTVPNCLEETPAWLYYPGEQLQHFYSEGVFVGYRYYDKRKMKPLFPFGFGLSYTSFEYQSLELSSTTLERGETISLCAVISNTGSYDGKEIAQVYIRFKNTSVPREPQALKAFAKVNVAAGQSQAVTFTLSHEDFAYYDCLRQRWVVEPGEYSLHVSRSSRHEDLCATVQVMGQPLTPILTLDSSLNEVCQHPKALKNVVALVANITGRETDVVEREIRAMAPELVFGVEVGLTEMMGLDLPVDLLIAAIEVD